MWRRRYLEALAIAGASAVAGCAEQEPPDPGEDDSVPDDDRVPPPPDEKPEDDEEDPMARFDLDERVDAVDDLGWDPEGERPIDDSFEESFDRDALVEVPPGTYLLEESHPTQELTNWALVGTGEHRNDVRFTIPEGERVHPFQVSTAARNVFLEKVTLDQGSAFDRSIGMTFAVDDNLHIRDVEKAGANTTEDPPGLTALGLNVVNPDGVAVVDRFVRSGPQHFKRYPKNSLTVFTGRSHKGTVYYRDLRIENGGENGIYASKGPGHVRVEGGSYKNNQGDNVRIAGSGSYVRGAEIVIDEDDWHPRNRGIWQQSRGIRMQSADMGYTGGVIEDTSLELRSSSNTQGLVWIEGSQGEMTMRNCELENHTYFRSFNAQRPHDGKFRPEKPWGVTLEDVTFVERGPEENLSHLFEHQAARRSAVQLVERPGSVLKNVSIEVTGSPPGRGSRQGIRLVDCKDVVLEDVIVNTLQAPLRIDRRKLPPSDLGVEFRGTSSLSANDVESGLSQEFVEFNDHTAYPFEHSSHDRDSFVVTSVHDDGMYGRFTGN